MKKTKLSAAIVSILIFGLAGCGGGDSETSPTGGSTVAQAKKIALSGSIYDEVISNAEVKVYVGGMLIGTAVADAQGKYTINLDIDADDLTKTLVIKAIQGSFTLVSMPGTAQALVDKASAASVNADGYPVLIAANVPELDVTNVSTAIFTIIEELGNNIDAISDAEIAAAITIIEGNAFLQELVLQVASSLKAVIDNADVTLASTGVTLESQDTEGLAKALVPDLTTFAYADLDETDVDNLGDFQTFKGNYNAEFDEAKEAVQADPTLSGQLIQTLDAAALLNNSFLVGEGNNTFVRFSGDPSATSGDLEVREFSNFTGTADTGTWSFANGVVSIAFTDSAGSVTGEFTLEGGSSNFIRYSAMFTEEGTTESEEGVLSRIQTDFTPPAKMAAFDTQEGTALIFKQGENCAMGAGNTAFVPIDDGLGGFVGCEKANGAYVFSNPQGGTEAIMFPLGGASATSGGFGYVVWSETSNSESGETFVEEESGFAKYAVAQKSRTSADVGRIVFREDHATGALSRGDVLSVSGSTFTVNTAGYSTDVVGTISALDTDDDSVNFNRVRTVSIELDNQTNVDSRTASTRTAPASGLMVSYSEKQSDSKGDTIVYRLPSGNDGTSFSGIIKYRADSTGLPIIKIETRTNFLMANLTVADVSGKSFSFEEENDNVEEVITVTFNANNSLMVSGSVNGVDNQSSETWAVNSAGVFVLTRVESITNSAGIAEQVTSYTTLHKATGTGEQLIIGISDFGADDSLAPSSIVSLEMIRFD